MSKRTVQGVCAISYPDGIFGEGNGLAWVFSQPNEDFERFKAITGEKTGGTVIMGRATWESIPEKFRPLPGRQNIVVTGNVSYFANGAKVVQSLDEALELATSSTISVIGGVRLLHEAVARQLLDTLHLTVVERKFPTTEQTVCFPQLLSARYLRPLICLSVERHLQPLKSGGDVTLRFEHYGREDV